METTSITPLLKSLTDYTHWNYAVLWKLNDHLPMTLTWEDAHYGCELANEAVESMCSDINFEPPDEAFSASIESTCGSGVYSVRLLMTEMSNLKYILGEGIVGRTALKGAHCWVFCDDVCTSNFNTDIISECPYEWLLQFASGIKTIVLVPVLPHGVLQFGSFEVVAEDLRFVANVKEKFNSIYCEMANTMSYSSDVGIQALSFSAQTDCLMDNLDESSSIANNKLKDKLSGSTSLNIDGPTRPNPTVPLFIHDECCMFGEDQFESLIKPDKHETSSPYVGVLKNPRQISQVDMNLIQTEEKLLAFSQWVNNVGVFDEISNGTCSSKDMTEQHFGGPDIDHKNCQDVLSLSDTSLDCDLYKTLGPNAGGQTAESLSKYFAVEDMYSCSTLMFDGKGQDYVKDLWFITEGDSEYLLDAVGEGASDDTSISISNDVKPPIPLQRRCTASIPPQSHSEESALIGNHADPGNYITTGNMANCMGDLSNLVTSRSFDDNISILIDGTQPEKVWGHLQPRSGPKLSRTSQKRARVGNSKRPRPKDRQLIMDRMKELRELVPDGARCSIDILLERTIKHMLYLKNITNRAEKLEQCLLQEVPECRKQKINGSHAGRSYAFDFESELQVCPMLIEELGCSGNMLIEMVCGEHGLFLEIANVFRRMELTILKGVLESRLSTMWASFIVEVPRGFHRMDIMYPLLHLLQLRKNNLN